MNVMKQTLIIVLLIASACSHRQGNTECSWKEFESSVDSCMAGFQDSNDTAYIKHAISLCDEILSGSTSTEQRYSVLRTKANLLGTIGMLVEAFEVRGESVCLLDTLNIERLEYMSMKSRLEGDNVTANVYLHKAVSECEKNKDDEDMVLREATCYILMGKKDMAKDVMMRYINGHTSSAVSYALDDFDGYISQVEEGVEVLSKAWQSNKNLCPRTPTVE